MIGSSLDILLLLPRAWFAYTTLNGTGVMGASNCVSVRIVRHSYRGDLQPATGRIARFVQLP